jgi:prevent-host-death family protein
MIQITATTLKANLGKYLALAGREEIHITRNGADIAVLAAPKEKRGWVDDLTGIIPNVDLDAKQIKAERLARRYESRAMSGQ